MSKRNEKPADGSAVSARRFPLAKRQNAQALLAVGAIHVTSELLAQPVAGVILRQLQRCGIVYWIRTAENKEKCANSQCCCLRDPRGSGLQRFRGKQMEYSVPY